MGVVYKAADILLGNRPVAVKEMSRGHLKMPELLSSTTLFRQEAMLLASLSHHHLPRIYDHFSEHGYAYLVMELINGETLADLLEQAGDQALLVDEVLLIAEQLCSVLDYLHTHQPPIIFRDLKPSNIMITYTGDHLYLIDFGIARIFKPAQLRDTLAFGTPGYAPPEQHGGATTERSDIFSLGVTLHQLLTGFDPAQARNTFHFPPIRLFNPQISPRLERLIAQMIEIDPERRPSSISIIKRELQYIKQEMQFSSFAPAITVNAPLVVPATPDSGVGTTLGMYQAHSDSVQALTWSPDGKYLASAGRDKMVHIWNTITGDKIYTYAGHTTYIYSLAWSPDSKRIISTSFATAHVWDALTANNVVIYHDHALWVYSASWSSDGRFIATGGADGEVHFWTDGAGKNLVKYRASSRVIKTVVWSRTMGSTCIAAACEDASVHCWNATTGAPPLIYKGHTKEVTSVSWSPNDQLIVSASRDKTIQVWDAMLGSLIYTYHGHAKEVYAVAWSPCGRYIASAGEDRTVHVVDAATGIARYIYRQHTNAVCTVAWSPDGKRIASAGEDKKVHIWQAC